MESDKMQQQYTMSKINLPKCQQYFSRNSVFRNEALIMITDFQDKSSLYRPRIEFNCHYTHPAHNPHHIRASPRFEKGLKYSINP